MTIRGKPDVSAFLEGSAENEKKEISAPLKKKLQSLAKSALMRKQQSGDKSWCNCRQKCCSTSNAER